MKKAGADPLSRGIRLFNQPNKTITPKELALGASVSFITPFAEPSYAVKEVLTLH